MNRMTDTIVLTERQMAVLSAVVEEYITSALPVSSSIIADRIRLHASPATIRNEMAHLEELGLLLQPHTSAGRIPTDTGYRYYVTHLLASYQTQRQETTALHTAPRDAGIAATCKLLGELTKYTTLALMPGWEQHTLRHIELAPVGADQLLVMLVTDNHQVMHSLSTVKDRPIPSRLRALNDLLNEEFGGKTLSAITDEALSTAVAKLPYTPEEFLRQAPEMVRRGWEHDNASRIFVEGTAHLFEQQDFADMPRLRALMEALHEASAFEQLFARSAAGQIQVSIGEENPHAGLEDCAIVFTSFAISEHVTGQLGVLGPKRMKYREVIQTLDAVVHNLDARLATDHEPANPQ